MTDEQRKVVEENHNLIYSFLNKHDLPIEEWYGLAAIGLCKAAIKFDASRGNNGGWSFATYAYKCMSNVVFHEIRKYYADKAIPEGMVLYYHDLAHETGDGDVIEFIDMLPSNLDVADEVVSKLIYERCRSKLNDRELLIFDMKQLGYKQREIAEVVGGHQSEVSRTMKEIRRKFRWLNC